MTYLWARNKWNSLPVRVLRIERAIGFYNDIDIWYIVPRDNEVVAMTPGDFDMSFEIIQMEAKNESQI